MRIKFFTHSIQVREQQLKAISLQRILEKEDEEHLKLIETEI